MATDVGWREVNRLPGGRIGAAGNNGVFVGGRLCTVAFDCEIDDGLCRVVGFGVGRGGAFLGLAAI